MIALVVGGVLLLGMVVTAGYAARTLPAGSRVPLNVGVPEYSVWLSKPSGLAAWLGVGAVAFAALSALTLNNISANWAESIRIVLLPSVMTVVLSAEAGAVIVARRYAAGSGGAQTPAESTAPQGAEPPESFAEASESSSEASEASEAPEIPDSGSVALPAGPDQASPLGVPPSIRRWYSVTAAS